MCGIAGVLRTGPAGDLETTAGGMARRLQHRGPDDGDVWVDPNGGIALGHRRLAIVDLSAAGHQPMHSASGRYIVVLNGEIYNHKEIRQTLEGLGGSPAWRGHSDTETLLAGIEAWGIRSALSRCVGMFALAVWDRHARTLHLARDRFGEKPLYFGWADDGTFLFASELKAFFAYPRFTGRVRHRALADYFRYAYVPAPWAIHENTYKLEPGCMMTCEGIPERPVSTVVPRAPSQGRNWTVSRWWVPQLDAALQDVNASEAVSTLKQRLLDAVRIQARADVPLGCFLSGGIDSSAVAALMQAISVPRVRTYTVAFDNAPFDESPFAREVAKHLGTEHTEMQVTSADALAVIPSLPDIYDEPFADSSQIPTYLVCKAARQHVTVALSGDGADELFGGYNRYLWGPSLWRRATRMPAPMRRALAATALSVSPATLDRLSGLLGVSRAGDKIHKAAAALGSASSFRDVYESVTMQWADNAGLLEPLAMRSEPRLLPSTGDDLAQQMMLWDVQTYLPDDVLCKVDRAAMAVSLETRTPYLDHRVAEFALALPTSMKIRDGKSKWALRQVLNEYVPESLIDRPKTGFSIPLGDWLRGPLREWAEGLMDESRIRAQGYLSSSVIRRCWNQHLSGVTDHSQRIWTILMFQSWLDKA